MSADRFIKKAEKLRNDFQEAIREVARKELDTHSINIDVSVHHIPTASMPKKSQKMGNTRVLRKNGFILFQK